jgi:hypothetical protein
MLSSYFRRQVVGQFEACESLRDRSSDSSPSRSLPLRPAQGRRAQE